MITDVEDFFTKGCGRCDRFATPDCSARTWAQGLNDLRRICRDAGLTETVKWGHPCYMHAGRNIAILGALKGEFRLGFFNVALLKDPEGLLERGGPNTRHPDIIRFRDSSQVAEREAVILSYLREVMGYAEQGIKPLREERILELPEELTEALDADPELAEAFHSLTPGRQRSYVIALGAAKTSKTSKTSKTRVARIAKFRNKIIAGKGATER